MKIENPNPIQWQFSQRALQLQSSAIREILKITQRPEIISFAGGLPAPELFDVDGLRAAYDRVLSGPHARSNLQYAPTEGDPLLRTLVADRLTRRGLPTAGSDLLVTTGSQQAVPGARLVLGARGRSTAIYL